MVDGASMKFGFSPQLLRSWAFRQYARNGRTVQGLPMQSLWWEQKWRNLSSRKSCLRMILNGLLNFYSGVGLNKNLIYTLVFRKRKMSFSTKYKNLIIEKVLVWNLSIICLSFWWNLDSQGKFHHKLFSTYVRIFFNMFFRKVRYIFFFICFVLKKRNITTYVL